MRYVWTSGLCVLPFSSCPSSVSIIIIKQSLLHHSVNARLCIYFVSACDYANIPWIWGEDLWDGWWKQHWRLWQHLSQPPVIVYTATSSEESAKQWNWKMQLNFTAHWLCHHELFIKMCNAQRFVTTNQLYQHSCSLSTQPQYNSGACSGMLTSYLLQYSYNRYSEHRVTNILHNDNNINFNNTW